MHSPAPPCVCVQTIADDNKSIAKSNECCFIETRGSHHQQHHQQYRQTKARLDDAVMHFSPPSKDSINTDFTNLNAISESGRNSVSRQSLIGECAPLGGLCVNLFRFFAPAGQVSSAHRTYGLLSSPPFSSFFSLLSRRLKQSFYHLSSPSVIQLLFPYPPRFQLVSFGDCAVFSFLLSFVFCATENFGRPVSCEKGPNMKFIGIKFNDT